MRAAARFAGRLGLGGLGAAVRAANAADPPARADALAMLVAAANVGALCVRQLQAPEAPAASAFRTTAALGLVACSLMYVYARVMSPDAYLTVCMLALTVLVTVGHVIDAAAAAAPAFPVTYILVVLFVYMTPSSSVRVTLACIAVVVTVPHVCIVVGATDAWRTLAESHALEHLMVSLFVTYFSFKQLNHVWLLIAELRAAQDKQRRFIANASHELRTPLHAIAAITEALQRSALVREHHGDDLDTLAESTDMLLTLVNNLLDLARLDAKRLVVTRVPTDVRAVVRRACSVAGSAHAGKTATHAVAARVAARVRTDGLHLGQVLLNLVTNAVKHGGARVHVSVDVVAPADGDAMLHFSITDNGTGVPPARAAALFEPFEQQAQSLNRGTGLGLTIAHRLAHALGATCGIGVRDARDACACGAVTVVAQGDARRGACMHCGEGVGAAFDFKIPYDAAPAPACAASPSAASSVLARPQPRRDNVATVTATPGKTKATRAAKQRRDRLQRQQQQQQQQPPPPPPPPPSPQDEPPDHANRGAASASTASRRQPTKRGALRVLVVDDTKTMAIIMGRQVERGEHGDVAHVVLSGTAALAELEAPLRAGRTPYDAVLLDVNMPDMSGHDVAQRVHAAARHGNVAPPHMIAVTATMGAAARAAALDSGMHAFLGKPFKDEALQQHLAAVRDQARRRDLHGPRL